MYFQNDEDNDFEPVTRKLISSDVHIVDNFFQVPVSVFNFLPLDLFLDYRGAVKLVSVWLARFFIKAKFKEPRRSIAETFSSSF